MRIPALFSTTQPALGGVESWTFSSLQSSIHNIQIKPCVGKLRSLDQGVTDFNSTIFSNTRLKSLNPPSPCSSHACKYSLSCISGRHAFLLPRSDLLHLYRSLGPAHDTSRNNHADLRSAKNPPSWLGEKHQASHLARARSRSSNPSWGLWSAAYAGDCRSSSSR